MASKVIAALGAMIEEATVDAYGDDEQLTDLFTMIERHGAAERGCPRKRSDRT
ncbi:hypothetical protein [Micromonospora echinofusca]|uniref:hypothetical protein n=1 Tax=Micromonospora echinofusca TaxID=47858 RepID=UPI0012FE11AA|nr:hypothetical protein [Micromonospora echinofusca]